MPFLKLFIHIIFCTFLSIRQGFLGYMLAILILFILQQSEIFVFPFTTGLLGLVIGTTFLYLQKREKIILIDCDSNFCNQMAKFIIKRDPKGIFRFSSLQSIVGKEMLRNYIHTISHNHL